MKMKVGISKKKIMHYLVNFDFLIISSLRVKVFMFYAMPWTDKWDALRLLEVNINSKSACDKRGFTAN